MAVLCLPGLRIFYKNIAQDWTRLSYGLIGFVLCLLGTVDFDEVPTLTVTAMLPALGGGAGAYAHLHYLVADGGAAGGPVFWADFLVFTPLHRYGQPVDRDFDRLADDPAFRERPDDPPAGSTGNPYHSNSPGITGIDHPLQVSAFPKVKHRLCVQTAR